MDVTQIISMVIGAGLTLLTLYVGYRIFLKMAIREFEKTGKTKICPKCGGLSISVAPSAGVPLGGIALLGYTRSTKFKCNKCPYEGIFPTIDTKNIEGFRKEIRKNRNRSNL